MSSTTHKNSIGNYELEHIILINIIIMNIIIINTIIINTIMIIITIIIIIIIIIKLLPSSSQVLLPLLLFDHYIYICEKLFALA